MVVGRAVVAVRTHAVGILLRVTSREGRRAGEPPRGVTAMDLVFLYVVSVEAVLAYHQRVQHDQNENSRYA